MKWMEPFLDQGEMAGKIMCPNKKCGAKLGNYDWAGVCCSCKEWVVPVSALACVYRFCAGRWLTGRRAGVLHTSLEGRRSRVKIIKLLGRILVLKCYLSVRELLGLGYDYAVQSCWTVSAEHCSDTSFRIHACVVRCSITYQIWFRFPSGTSVACFSAACVVVRSVHVLCGGASNGEERAVIGLGCGWRNSTTHWTAAAENGKA